MMRLIVFLIFLLSAYVSSAQVTDYWQVLSNGETLSTVHSFRGDSLFQLGQVKQAIVEYRLQNKEKYGICKYELACAYAGDRQTDSAFKYLNLNLQYDTSIYALINPDFLFIRNDPRWTQFENRWLDSVLHYNPDKIIDIPLARKLWHMYALDQAYFYEMKVLNPLYGDSSALMSTFQNLKQEINQENERLLDSIVTVKGWPKISQVGNAASAGAFLIVQHAPLETQQKYLPIIRKRCEEKEARWENYAHVYDRIQMLTGKPQLYGTQCEYFGASREMRFYPIEDEANVNKRRAEFGMRPIEEYAEMMGFEYEAPK